jgi:hypothetical protein
MNYIYQQKIKSDQHRALAIEADQSNFANPITIGSTLLNQFVVLAMSLVRALIHINPTSQTSKPFHKLKMQLLVIYSIPAFFIFGASAIILVVMYLCIFELVLHLAPKSVIGAN